MDKRRAIQIMTKAAALYHANLEDQKIIFLYGLPAEIRKQLQEDGGKLISIKSYEVAFHRHNFLHLTGVRANNYSMPEKVDKGINIRKCFFSEEIEKMLKRETTD